MTRSFVCLLFVLITPPLQAGALDLNSGERQVTLLELYTSQGCSSCPPAERWLNDYVEEDALWQSIVPVAFHVDYWDYIGWKDPYATAANGERQRDYARAGHARTVYTPGFFANGREWRGWTLRLGPRASRKQPGNLAVRVEDGRLKASFPSAGKSLLLNIAILGFGIETGVLRGENRNRILGQEFVALAHDTHRSANGQWHVPLPAYDRQDAPRFGLAVWVSAPDLPVPLQATGGWLQ
jgi:hypothetical protein